MNMPGDAGACSFAQVHSQVETLRMVEVAQNAFEPPRELHHFLGGFGREQLELVYMLIGNDHDMAGGVRVGVQNDEAVLVPMDNEGLFVVSGLGQLTKQA